MHKLKSSMTSDTRINDYHSGEIPPDSYRDGNKINYDHMKLYLGIALFLVLSTTINAQDVKLKMDLPEMDLSTQLLGILNATDGLDLNADQKDKLMMNNSSFVDQLIDINKSEKSDDDKKTAFLGLKNNRTKFLTELLGNDIVKKYSGKVLKSINPLKSKLGLAALAF
ncbi:hypothetical protein SYJ56_17910 [Algoriphagus sp. D3-2-R+10]|uniref:hypothetical protein n=1 Tax=Algoriphagus aurantiacus TaxID=3103948 RepID=UPI002B3D4FF5|nr:hypothetical protein [Algoriphagus sp. D3-2-R+10]MEB2777196.1 hypothetical protein [Algoriphagus sp. D3-2-R+10]